MYNYQDLVAAKGTLPQQRFSVRGEGTPTQPGPDNGVWTHGGGPDGSFFQIEQVGRFQVRDDMLEHWQEIGTVVQGPAITGYPATFNQNYFLEVSVLNSVHSVNSVYFPWKQSNKSNRGLKLPFPVRGWKLFQSFLCSDVGWVITPLPPATMLSAPLGSKLDTWPYLLFSVLCTW